jgi:Neisseria PilC beta-propeller domain
MQPSELKTWFTRRSMRHLVAPVAAAGLAAMTIASWAAPVFLPDSQPTGWVARPALSSNELKSGNEVIFRPDFRAGPWTGTIKANYIGADGDVQGGSPWPGGGDSGSLLTGMPAGWWDTGRIVVTRNAVGSNVPFRWASLSPSQTASIGDNTLGPKILNFIRGDRSSEKIQGGTLRNRETIQGDIQHSTVIHWRHSAAVRRVYVGGNDGMLHAFDAATGAEVFAYVPSMLISRLNRLSADPYVRSLYVDGGQTVADVVVGGGMKTLLAGALGGGGKGLYMLDVSNPSPATEAAAAAQIKWEISSASVGFANLGYTYAAPKIGRLRDGTAVVIVGNGYLNSGSGKASLFIINADTGALIREIDTGSGSTTSPNGLSTATLVDTDQDGKVDYAYAGDIDGKLWRFDLTAALPAAYSVTNLMTTDSAQAITIAPVVASHPKGGRMVMFGTGRTLAPADSTNTAVHYVYGFWDAAPVANTTWLDQTITEVTYGTQRLRTVSSLVPNWASGGHKGWRLTLPAGERLVGESPFASDDRFYFTSTNPTVAAAAEGQAAGTNWLMEVNILTGGSPATAIFDVNNDGTINATDNISGSVIIGKNLGAGVTSQAVLTDLNIFSLSLYNRQSNLDYSVPASSSAEGSGVSGGHFDVDFYFMSGTSFRNFKHKHEYDDTYDVTGVNMMNASDPIFNLGTKMPAAQAFKVLVMNQYLNPASTLSVGGQPFVGVKNFWGQASQTDPALVLVQGPTGGGYTMATINSLIWKLPLDAFQTKDWWGDGGTQRAGLIPTTTGCVNKVNADGSTPTLGLNGERHNGALTIQLIKADTPATALELNYAAGGPKYGWRVKQAQFTTYVLGEYTMFWHHPNGKCYGQAGWTPAAPQDFDGDGGGVRPVGSGDPSDGSFGAPPAGVSITNVTTTTVGAVTTIVVTYSDGKKDTTVITNNGNGTEGVVWTDRDGSTTTGNRVVSSDIGRAPEEILQGSRRINWREVLRM